MKSDLMAWKARLDAAMAAAGPSLSEMKTPVTYSGKEFSFVTGGAPLSCGEATCTIAFCWQPPDFQTEQQCWLHSRNAECNEHNGGGGHCLTVHHAIRRVGDAADRCSNPKLHVSGKEIETNISFVLAPQVPDEDHRDILVIELPRAQQSVLPLSLLYSRYQVPIIGYTIARNGDAVWKLGYQTAISSGKVADSDDSGLLIEGIPVEAGDSGGSICLARSFTHCILVGMVVHGNNATKELRGISAKFLSERVPGWPLTFTVHPGDVCEQQKLQHEMEIQKLQAQQKLQHEFEIQKLQAQIQNLQHKIEIAQKDAEILKLKTDSVIKSSSPAIKQQGEVIQNHHEQNSD